MTSEDLKVVIRTDYDDTGLKKAKKSVEGLSKSMKEIDFGEGTEGAKNFYDKLDSLRHMDFPELLVNVANIGTAMKVSKEASKVALNDISVKMAQAKFKGEELRDTLDAMKTDLKRMETGNIKFDYVEDAEDAMRDLRTQIELTNKDIKLNGVEISELEKKYKNAGGEGSKAFGLIDKSALKVLATVALVAAAVGSLVAATRNALNTATRMKETFYEASSLGLTVSQYQEWGYIFESVGESVDDLADAVKTLSSEQAILAEGSDGNKAAFKELGLSVAQVTKMTQDELFRETITRLQGVEDAVKRTTLAYQIFGEDTAARLTNILNLNNAEMVRLSENFYLLGGGASSGFIEKSKTLASSIQNLKIAWTGLTNTLAEVFMPVVTTVVNALTKAIVVVNLFLKTIFGLDFTPAADAAGAVTGNLSSIGSAASGAKDEVEKLRKATMGFDELNIVTNPASSKSDDGSGAGGGIGDGAIGVTESAFDKAKVKFDEFKNKVQGFLDKWEDQIKIIAAALGALGITKLLTHFKDALKLSDGFLKTLDGIKRFAKAAIVITLQYSLVNEFMSSYIDSGELKDYIAGLITAAIGTGILYKIWKPGGLMIGLAVTAVASLKAVVDNGGITNTESAIVAFTGLASALGVMSIAWKKLSGGLKIGNVINALKTAAFGTKTLFDSLKGGNAASSALVFMFPKLTAALEGIKTAFITAGDVISKKGLLGVLKGLGAKIIAPITKVLVAIKGLAAGIGTALGLTGGAAIAAGAAIIVAAIAAIAGVVIFLKRHWDDLTAAFKNFFNENIAPKIEAIKESFEKIKTTLGNLVTTLVETFPWLDTIFQKIGEFFAWLGNIEWIQVLATGLEWLGGIIVGLLSGVLMGAFQGAVSMIEGFIQAISGVVEVVSGVVQLIIGIVTLDGQKIVDAFKLIGSGVWDAIQGLYKATIGVVIEWVKGIIDWCVKLWDELVGHSIIPDMVEAIIDWFWKLPGEVFKAIKEFVNGIINRVKELWANITSWFGTNVAPKFTKQYWANKFDTVRAAATEKFNAVKNTIQNIWNSIKTWFSSNVAPKFTASYWTNKFGSIKDGAKSAFNGAIGVVEKAVNGIIGKVNTLSWTIPDWVPNFGGDKFGFNFKTISIPRLATGGITTGSVVANIGEAGREAVLPLDRNTGWMDLLADRIAARSNNPTKVILKMGEKEVGEAVIHAINQNTRMNGGLQLQLV